MNLTRVWDQIGFPHASAVYQGVLICPNQITAPNNPPFPAEKFYCSLAGGQPEPLWPVSQALYVLIRADGQTQASVSVHTSLAAAQAGTGAIATWADSPTWQYNDFQAEQADLSRVGSSTPDLDGFKVAVRPIESAGNPLWSVYQVGASVSPAINLCDTCVEILQAHTGEGESLAGVESITCGPREELTASRVSIRVTVDQAKRSDDVAEIGRRHLMIPVSVQVTVQNDLGSQESAWRRCREILAAVHSILSDEKANQIAFRMVAEDFSSPAPLGGELFAYRGILRLEADLLTEG